MRRLMIFALSFAGAVAVYLWLIPNAAVLYAAFGALALLIGLLFVRAERVRRVRIAAFGAAVALFWCMGYERMCIAPLRALCGEDRLLTAEVADAPEPTKYGCRVLVRAAGGRIMLYLNDEYATLEPGDRVTLRAQIVDVSDGGEAENLSFQARDISLLAFPEGKVTVEQGGAATLRTLPARTARAIEKKITALFPADTAPFMRALLMGETSGLTYETENRMSVTGISHIVSVSGMHISLLVGALRLLCFRKKRLTAGVGIGAMMFFAAMLDFQPSVTRAVIMNSIVLLAPLVRRENDAPTTLSAALLVILLGNPWALASLSLQLSFGAMAGIVLLTPRIYDRLLVTLRYASCRNRLLAGVIKAAALNLAMSLGAMIFTTPRIAVAFQTVSVIAPVSNLLTMSVLSRAFTGGFAVVLAGFAVAPLGKAGAWVLSWAVRLVLWVIEALSDVPYAAVYTDRFYIAAWLVAAYLMLGVFFLCRKRKPAALLASIVGTLAVAVVFCSLSRPECSVTALDVGQGQCILLESGGVCVAVDCGGSYADETGEQLARRLLMSGERKLDALVLTHFDTDHVGGVMQLLSRMEIGAIFAPDISDDSGNREVIECAAEAAQVPLNYVRRDTTLEFAGGCVKLFAPEQSFSDNDGLAALMSLQECDILITGDMDIAAEHRLLQSHALPDVEILVAGHHGAANATGARLLAVTKPEAVIISVGKNSYGHPTSAALERIAAVGAAVYRTDLDGDITILR